ncbi:hypothetical protein ACLOJK_015714 [Asimina triloba]
MSWEDTSVAEFSRKLAVEFSSKFQDILESAMTLTKIIKHEFSQCVFLNMKRAGALALYKWSDMLRQNLLWEKEKERVRGIRPILLRLLFHALSTNWVTKEANSLLGVGEEVEWVETQFRWMQAFLKDAAAKSDKDERVTNWVREVRNLAHHRHFLGGDSTIKAAATMCFGHL